MQISSIVLSNFTKHDDSKLSLPQTGIVAVTGTNGSGKSSILEAVATACFGETLRGTSPWRDGVSGFVEVETDQVIVKRQRTDKGKSSVKWQARGVESMEYETSTKAQEALEHIIGSFLVWRRTCVFSSQDAAHFTLATDADRKRLLENILNLHKFDAALDACRAERKKAESKENTYVSELASLRAKLESELLRVRDAKATVAAMPAPLDIDATNDELSRLAKFAAQANDDISRIADEQKQADRDATLKEAGVLSSSKKLKALEVAVCASCGQPISQAARDALRAQVDAERQVADEAKAKAEKLREELGFQLDELREEKEALQQKQFEVQAKLQAHKQNLAQRQSAEERLASAEASVQQLQTRIEKGEVAVEKAKAETALLTTVETVLGVRGVRNHILGKTLAGIEAVANDWLSKIAGDGLRLRLRPYVEKKTGGVSDAISLEVEGAGGGHGYKAASGGERRRIDVALLLALAEVAQASYGRNANSTLFFDECMDSLDADGIVAVSRALRDLSQTRCIVVISHNTDLIEELRPDIHARVVAGTLTT